VHRLTIKTPDITKLTMSSWKILEVHIVQEKRCKLGVSCRAQTETVQNAEVSCGQYSHMQLAEFSLSQSLRR